MCVPGPVLLGCCQPQLTSLSSMIVLQPPFLCQGWGGHPLCLSGNISLLMDLHWPCSCTAQEQYSVHRFSICRSSVRHFPERSWTGQGGKKYANISESYTNTTGQ